MKFFVYWTTVSGERSESERIHNPDEQGFFECDSPEEVARFVCEQREAMVGTWPVAFRVIRGEEIAVQINKDDIPFIGPL